MHDAPPDQPPPQAPLREPPVVVQKYGGSSVADADRLGRVADRVAATARSGRRVVVVVSAMGKTTDQLIALAREVSPSPPRRELDMLLSTGERVSMALLAMALGERGIDAISFTGSQSGILTNDRHSGARIIEVRPVRIEDELACGRVVIVAGFQGMSYRREITTLGRGGSDTTAVALAAALRAEYCEICSDVDGVYTADPRVVPEARRIEHLGYDAMQEMAEHGAKVLHAQAVEWARRAGIDIHAVATATPPVALGGRGTRIGAHPSQPAIAVAGSRRLVRARVFGAGPDTAGALLRRLADEGVALRRFSMNAGSADGQVELLFAPDDVPDLARLLAALAAAHPGAVVDERAEVAAVGAGAGADAALVGAAFAAGARACGGDLTVEATPMRVSLYVPPARADDTTRAVHAALVVETPPDRGSAGRGV